MRTSTVAATFLLSLAISLAGCGDDDGGTGAIDSGVGAIDSGAGATDSGVGAIDSGVGAIDSGAGTSTCGACADCFMAVQAACATCPTDSDCDTPEDPCASAERLEAMLGCAGCSAAAMTAICM